MTENYLKTYMLQHFQQNTFLLEKVLLYANARFFVWDLQKKDNLWLNNEVFNELGYSNFDNNNLIAWKNILKIDSIADLDFTNVPTNECLPAEIVFVNFNKIKITVKTEVFAVKNNVGNPTKLIAIFDNKKLVSDTNLKKIESQFGFISENISDGIFIVENSKMIFASNSYLKMTGMSYKQKEAAQNDDPLHNIHPEDKERIRTLLTATISSKIPSVKYIFRCKQNDNYIWREDIMNLQYGNDNDYKAIIITRDITQEKMLELLNIDNRKKVDLQNTLLIKLYSNSNQLELQNKINLITKIALEGLNVDRSNYWELENDTLICRNHSDIKQDESSLNVILNIRDLPIYYNAIQTKTAIIADDVLTNLNTAELKESYLKPLGITDMLDIPVRENGQVHGVLCFEHRDGERKWSESDVSFAKSLADFLSLSLEEDRRKKAEQTLIYNQERLKFISENTSDGILIIENDKISYASSVYVKLSGYTEEFLKNLSLTEIFNHIHPNDLSSVKKCIYANIEAKNKRFSFEYRIKGTNNKYYWREDSANVIYKNKGLYQQIILISRDISERKKSEKKLIESEQQLRLISENSTDGFIVIENGIIVFISPSYLKFLDYDAHEIHGKKTDFIFEKIHPEDKDKIYNFVYNNLKKQETSFKAEFRLKNKAGKYCWREDSTNVVYDENGKYTKYIVISRNIHERKIAEQKLIESEQQLRILTENTSDGLYIIENNIVKFVSPTYLKLLNLNSIQNLTSDDIFKYFHPEDLLNVKPYIYDCLRNQLTAFKYEVRFKEADGNFNWREDSANVLYNKQGEYLKYIVVSRDISERKEAEFEKIRLHKITESQNKKLVNFTHIVSHDIRSHTSNLSMILDLFEETKQIEDQEKYFRMMRESTNKLSDTIFYLNETVAIQSGKNNDFKSLNLKKEIEKAIEGVKAFVKTNETLLIVDIDSAIQVNVTQSYLESIMFNLLTNAIKYKSNKRKPEISIIAKTKNNQTELTIKDNGIGIDLERNKDKIFGMYKTFHGNEDAVGLGLFMVKNHIESMGGSIEVESQVDRGTTFKLVFA